MNLTEPTLAPVLRANLTDQVYETLRLALLEGRLWPRQRLKIRDLAAALQVSETPVREAIMQLARERALSLQSNRSLSVPRLTITQYLELREVRIELEGMAALRAVENVTKRDVRQLEKIQASMMAARQRGAWSEAIRCDYYFHNYIHQAARRPELTNIIDVLRLRTGPIVNYQYPHVMSVGPTRHLHYDVIHQLKLRDPEGTRKAVQADTLQGAAALVDILTQLDSGILDEDAFRASIFAPDVNAPLKIAPLGAIASGTFDWNERSASPGSTQPQCI